MFAGQAPTDIVAAVAERATQERPDLIIVDTMQRFLRANSTDDYAEMTLLFDQVIGIANRSGAAVSLVTHNSKADRAGLDAILGSTAIAGSVDTAILLTRTDRYRTISSVQRTGEDMAETVLLLDADTGRVYLGGTRREADAASVAEKLLEALAGSEKPLTRAEWFDLVEARKSDKLAAMKAVPGFDGNQQGARVVRTGEGTRNHPHRYAYIRSVSGSQVPLKGGNLNSEPPCSDLFSNDSSKNTGSRIPTQEPPLGQPPDSREPVFQEGTHADDHDLV